MKPMMILPKGAMSKDDPAELRKNDVCVVEAEEPSRMKFVDSIPALASRTQIEQAAIQLSRKILQKGTWTHSDTSKEMESMFVGILIKGTALDPMPSQAEQEKEIFNREKQDELRRIAREEARAERAAQKAAHKKATPSASECEWKPEEKTKLVSLRKEHPDWTWKAIGEAMGKDDSKCASMWHGMKSRGQIPA